jgi:hypothetical protein
LVDGVSVQGFTRQGPNPEAGSSFKSRWTVIGERPTLKAMSLIVSPLCRISTRRFVRRHPKPFPIPKEVWFNKPPTAETNDR